MEFPQDQITELFTAYSGGKQLEEGGTPYFFLPGHNHTEGGETQTLDLLLRPVKTDGYDSRLYFSQKPKSPRTAALNWNADGVHIISRTWYAFSWTTREGLTLAQMVAMHLRALR